MNLKTLSIKQFKGISFILILAVMLIASGPVAAQDNTKDYDHEVQPDAMYWQDDVLMYESTDLSQGDTIYLYSTDENGDRESVVRVFDVEETGPEGNPAVYVETEQIEEKELGSFALMRPNGPSLIEFKVRNQEISVSNNIENGVVSNEEDTELTSEAEFEVDSNRTAYDLWITVQNKNLDEDALEQMFGDQGRVVYNDAGYPMLNENGNTVYGINVTNEGKTVIADTDSMPTGEYDLRFYVKDSNVSATQNMNVLDARNKTVDFNSKSYQTELGQSVPITVYFENYNETTLRLENEETTYSADITITDYTGPQSVQLNFNTTSGTFELVGDQENVDLIDRTRGKAGPSSGEFTASTNIGDTTTASVPLLIEGQLKRVSYEFVDQNGDSVTAEMTFDGNTKTGESVQYVVPETESEPYTYTVKANGYTNVGGETHIDSNQEDTITMLPSTIEYTVTVEDQDTQPVDGATVSIAEETVTTGSDGTATFDLEVGQTYDVEVTGENIENNVSRFEVDRKNPNHTVGVTDIHTYIVNLSNSEGDDVDGRLDINGESYDIENGSVSVDLTQGSYTGEVYTSSNGSIERVDTVSIELIEDTSSDVIVASDQSTEDGDGPEEDGGFFSWVQELISNLFG